MEYVAEQIGDIDQLRAENFIQFLGGYRIFVCESNWNGYMLANAGLLLNAGFRSLECYIDFIPMNEICYTSILELRRILGGGLSIDSLSKLHFSNTRCIPLITDDKAVVRAAGIVGVQTLSLIEFRKRLLSENGKDECYELVQKKIRR